MYSKKTIDNLNGLFDAVYHDIIPGNDHYHLIYKKSQKIIEDIEKALNYIDQTKPRSATVKLTGLMSKLIRYLNNVGCSLRPGDSSWNSSVGYSFDPEEWVFLVKLGNIFKVTNSNKKWNITEDLYNYSIFNSSPPVG